MSDFLKELFNTPEIAKSCADCGREFKTAGDRTRCSECEYYRDHPLEKPKVWTWARVGSQWGIAAYWPDHEPPPAVGATVTVNKKDGSTSSATIRELEGIRYQPDGQGKMYCYIS